MPLARTTEPTRPQQPYALMLDDAVMANCGYIVGPIVFDDRGRMVYIETRKHDDDSESFYLVERALPRSAAIARSREPAAAAPAGGRSE